MGISQRKLEATRPRVVRTAQADARAPDVAAIVAELQAAGITSLRAIAAELNARGIPTATGVGKWRAAQVWRVRAHLPRRLPRQ
jgi:hypothetical protein